VRFDVRREQTATVFEVSDRGIGIPPEEIAHLFESFHRASNVGAIQGTGLGLAIVKNAVEMHGGAIEVKSKLGEGTTFRVRLPGD
jgi:signal transduction histidine kinase